MPLLRNDLDAKCGSKRFAHTGRNGIQFGSFWRAVSTREKRVAEKSSSDELQWQMPFRQKRTEEMYSYLSHFSFALHIVYLFTRGERAPHPLTIEFI